MCLYEAQISGERLQDHWSSGLLVDFRVVINWTIPLLVLALGARGGYFSF